MSLPLVLVVIAALLAVTVAIGLLARRRDGRRRDVRGDRRATDAAELGPGGLGDRATLVQFSTELCARCPQARRVLDGVAAQREGVVRTEVDLTHRADLASRHGILSTPTTFLLDPDGTVRSRFHGVPRPAEVLAAIDELTPAPAPTAKERRAA
ncbi:thioredoxin family protein [Microbacterium resistens]|uniref:Thioredoxin family protein n=1 Tax=Microbacterium resistens TaxID=156977 RepID=A0ABY3RV98_9MICO|nr:thioredoxin family protein [Microbacterium resistens]UGS27884.1 thioredoxin family protein [Microbacterium resistens]